MSTVYAQHSNMDLNFTTLVNFGHLRMKIHLLLGLDMFEKVLYKNDVTSSPLHTESMLFYLLTYQ